LDAVIPNILPFGFTLLIYWLMKRGWTSLKVIGLIVVIGVLGGMFGILS
jgi:PTS system mannose-specific IID component